MPEKGIRNKRKKKKIPKGLTRTVHRTGVC